MLSIIALVLAFVFFVIAAFQALSKEPSKIRFEWLGFACWALSILLRGVRVGG
jgi:hypothetical protein